jgi:glycosyltransferase involved in cell wall biosynthesis
MQELETPQAPRSAGVERARTWHIVTCEYPPRPGGVSDYTYLVAKGLASVEDEVHVWCPALPGEAPQAPGVEVHPTLGHFSLSDLRRTGLQLDRFAGPRRLFLQWVPHGFGYKAVNLPFCLWVWYRSARRGDVVDLMVHEPFLGFKKTSLRQSVAALIQRLMMAVLLRTAARVWLSTPAWEQFLRPWEFGPRHVFNWLPIPSNIPVSSDSAAAVEIRRKYAQQDLLIGHFSTFGPSITQTLHATVPQLLRQAHGASLLLIGMGSTAFRLELIRDNPELGQRIHATEYIRDGERLSEHLSACDLLIQPYSDGVTSRRTTIMAALSHGRATVTTTGPLTESFWASSGAVEVTPEADHKRFVEAALRLLQSRRERIALGKNGLELYQREFDVPRVIGRLLNRNSQVPSLPIACGEREPASKA